MSVDLQLVTCAKDQHSEISSDVSVSEQTGEGTEVRVWVNRDSTRDQADMNHKEKQTVLATNGRWVGKQTPRAIERRGNAWLSGRAGVSDVRGRGLCGRLHMLASFKEITGPCCTGQATLLRQIPL